MSLSIQKASNQGNTDDKATVANEQGGRGEEWLQATDWDDPLDVAFLYKDASASNGCGHIMEWKATKLVDCRYCPICHETVGLICDGVVATSCSTATKDSSSSVLSFKYGKQLYRLSVSARQKSNPSFPSLKYWMTSWITTTSSSGSDLHNVPITAQDRIQQALGLVGVKVLHKGKVLYSSKSTATNQGEASSSSLKISQRLLETSEWPKPSLVVMGTIEGRELKGRPSSHTTYNTMNLFFFSLTRLVSLPWNIVRYGLRGSLLFARTFLSPFFPRLSPSSEHQDNGQDRPHRD